MAVVIKRLKKDLSLKAIKMFKINEIILRSQQRIKSEAHNVFTEKVNTIEINLNDL